MLFYAGQCCWKIGLKLMKMIIWTLLNLAKVKFFMIPAEITLFYWYEKCTNSCFLTAHLKWIECLCPTELTLSALSSCRQNVKDAFVWGPKYHKISKIVSFTLNLTNIQLYVVNWLAKKAPNIRLILSSLQN